LFIFYFFTFFKNVRFVIVCNNQPAEDVLARVIWLIDVNFHFTKRKKKKKEKNEAKYLDWNLYRTVCFDLKFYRKKLSFFLPEINMI